jgi:hypothetical protein
VETVEGVADGESVDVEAADPDGNDAATDDDPT